MVDVTSDITRPTGPSGGPPGRRARWAAIRVGALTAPVHGADPGHRRVCRAREHRRLAVDGYVATRRLLPPAMIFMSVDLPDHQAATGTVTSWTSLHRAAPGAAAWGPASRGLTSLWPGPREGNRRPTAIVTTQPWRATVVRTAVARIRRRTGRAAGSWRSPGIPAGRRSCPPARRPPPPAASPRAWPPRPTAAATRYWSTAPAWPWRRRARGLVTGSSMPRWS
jgi:hypothetical protein